MSNSEDETPPRDSDVNLPPIKLPEPDPFDTTKSNEGKNSFLKKKKKQDKKKGRHPLDRYQDVRKAKKGMGCCGGIGCFALIVVLLVVGAAGYGGYLLFGDFKDYTIVQLEGAEETISTAPGEPTFYFGKGKVVYNAPQSSVPIGVFGSEVEVSGEFFDNLSIRSPRVTLRSGTHVHKNLNIFAVEYIDEGAVVDGKKSGKTLQ
ncbi:MAG: hypothetical protein P1V20_28750 [Verrucomicrobiales bacterium]|nr:hypothetical protein [Verrucomicrobiales bacterium]